MFKQLSYGYFSYLAKNDYPSLMQAYHLLVLLIKAHIHCMHPCTSVRVCICALVYALVWYRVPLSTWWCILTLSDVYTCICILGVRLALVTRLSCCVPACYTYMYLYLVTTACISSCQLSCLFVCGSQLGLCTQISSACYEYSSLQTNFKSGLSVLLSHIYTHSMRNIVQNYLSIWQTVLISIPKYLLRWNSNFADLYVWSWYRAGSPAEAFCGNVIEAMCYPSYADIVVMSSFFQSEMQSDFWCRE